MPTAAASRDRRYAELQARYLLEMRGIMPEVLAWWTRRAVTDLREFVEAPARNDFERRWPAGPSAHPRVIAVFRKYFLELAALNDRIEDSGAAEPEDEDEEGDWGVEDEDPVQDLHVAASDLLIDDIEGVASDVYLLVRMLVFVPVGRSPNGEYA